MAADTLRQECDERIGEYRENGAGKDRDPLQNVKLPLGHAAVMTGDHGGSPTEAFVSISGSSEQFPRQ